MDSAFKGSYRKTQQIRERLKHMAKSSKHDATDSALGFYFQACYALILLLDAGDDDSVSVETRDDVELIGKNAQLNQLKHTLGTAPALTEKNDGLWNTIGIWLDAFLARKHSFVFVTCAGIDAASPLLELAEPSRNRDGALKLLVDEAERVVASVKEALAEVAKGKKTNADIPYKDRISPCREFLKLSPIDRKEFLQRITILHSGFNATALRTEVEKRLDNYRKATRPQLAERLLEWWDRRVARSLLKELSRQITKDELLERLHSLNDELSDDNLPDDFSLLEPPTLDPELGTMMEEQIKLVGGGVSRISRAAKARWRARSQRDRWIASAIGMAAELATFDKGVLESWQDRHAPLRDDCKEQGWDDSQKRKSGLALLDWSHLEAWNVVTPPRPKWDKPFLTQGTYQQLADELKVGWHPEYEKLLTAARKTATRRLARKPRKAGHTGSKPKVKP